MTCLLLLLPPQVGGKQGVQLCIFPSAQVSRASRRLTQVGSSITGLAASEGRQYLCWRRLLYAGGTPASGRKKTAKVGSRQHEDWVLNLNMLLCFIPAGCEGGGPCILP